jgi:ribosomal protein L11 methyltransferase
MSWLELSVAADQEAAEAISELLAQYGYQGGVVVEALPPADAPSDEAGVPQPLESAPAYPVMLRTYLPLDEQAEEQRQRIEQALWHLGQLRPVGKLQVRVLEEQDWANAWKQFYTVQRIGEHTVIVPSWLEYTPQPGDVVLHLDPGMAFGTGLHPTTQLCLRLLERFARSDARMLDLGTGSGILSIAAARQGSTPVLALDNDPVAVDVARENISRNGVSSEIHTALSTAGRGDLHPWLADETAAPDIPVRPPFDLIVANIIAAVLIDLSNDLAALLAPGGILISSGIILERADEVSLAFAAAGLNQRERHVEGEWVALVHMAP